MIKNTTHLLSPSSPALEDARNTIKYTLLLPYPSVSPSDDTALIPSVLDSTQLCCSRLFSENPDRISYTFFGTASSLKENVGLPLEYWDLYAKPENPADRKPAPLHSLLLQHCIISSYHALLTELCGTFPVTSYSIVNVLKGEGIDSFIRNNKIFSGNTNVVTRLMCRDAGKSAKSTKPLYKSKKASSMSSDFQRASMSHCKNIPYIKDLFISENSRSNENKPNTAEQYFFQFANLYQSICSISATKWRSYFSPVSLSAESVSTRFKTQSQIREELIEKANLNAVDKVYNQYLTERIFSFDLINCLIQNIYKIESAGYYSLSSKSILKILSKCQKLPNALNRIYLLQYAFDKFLSQPDSSDDFWFQSKINAAVLLPGDISTGFQFANWLQQFSYFCDYMSTFVIPVYEWCFLSLLMDSIKERYPSKTYSEQVLKGFTLLSDYIKINYQLLLNPFQGRKDIIQPTNLSYLPLAPDVLDTILSLFRIGMKNIELNIHALNPEFFLPNNNESSEPVANKVRKFYTNLIRDIYL